jgi:hypothetical protein
MSFWLFRVHVYFTISTFYFTGKSNNVGNLFQSAGEIGKELETLVTVMTDDSNGEGVKY